jgi:hypothetical protein
MNGLLTALGGIIGILSLVCWIIILIDAFKNEVWKGIVGFLCGLYLLYYAVAEFQHEKKWLIVIGWLIGGFVGGALINMGILAGAMGASSSAPLTP